MLTRASARPAMAAAAGLACLTFALAGCSGPSATSARDEPTARSEPTARDSSASAPTTARESVDAQPTESTSSAAPEETTSTQPSVEPSATPAPSGGGLRGRLLTAEEMPGFNSEFRWSEASTRSREPRTPFGTCQRFDMTTIGATDVAVRTFKPRVPEAGDQAGELVAEFPDSTTARRAFAVLKAWRATCADRLKRYQRSKVGELEDVPVEGGTGGWYLLTYGPVPGDPEAAYFDAQGMAVVGSRIAMVELIAPGQDYNYEPGHEPMVTAVQRAAAHLS